MRSTGHIKTFINQYIFTLPQERILRRIKNLGKSIIAILVPIFASFKKDYIFNITQWSLILRHRRKSLITLTTAKVHHSL